MDIKQLSQQFQEMATLARRSDDEVTARFKAKAYQKAATTLQTINEHIPTNVPDAELQTWFEERGLGNRSALKAVEVVRTGTFQALEAERAKNPNEQVVQELCQIRGLGEKMAKRMVAKHGLKSLADLKDRVNQGLIKEKTLLKALVQADQKLIKRWPRQQVETLIEPIVTEFKNAFPGVLLEICGSYRRGRDTVKDVDILICGAESGTQAYTDWFAQKIGTTPRMHGPDTLETTTSDGLLVDIRVVPPESWGAGLVFFTGPKEFNIDMRAYAKRRGFSLNRYALTEVESGKTIASLTEQDIFTALNLEYQTPAEREQAQRIRVKSNLAKLG